MTTINLSNIKKSSINRLKRPSLFKSALVMSVTLLSAMTFSVQASDCKGLEAESCTAKAVCGWVEAYTRKDGREVKSFCRTSTKGRVNKSGEDEIVKKKIN